MRRRGDVAQPQAGVGLGHFAEDAIGQFERFEQFAVGQQHLGLAEKQVAVLVQREVEPGENVALTLGIEIHQRVAADDQVEVRDRRIAHQVMPAEDHTVAQVAVEAKAAVYTVKVFLTQVFGHRLNVALVVGGGARLVKGVLIHVGGINLDALAELFGSHLLAQEHGQGVSFFAGGAAGAPEAKLRRWAALAYHRRQHVFGEVVPRFSIAEKRGDVDQDCVKKRDKLVRVGLQIILICAEAVEVDRLHALGHPPANARALIPGKIKSVGVFEKLQQPLEFRVHRLVGV